MKSFDEKFASKTSSVKNKEDETSVGQKRKTAESDEDIIVIRKKLKLTVDNSPKEVFSFRDMKGKLKKLQQEELEELIIHKIVESFTMSSEIGKLREAARLSEKRQEAMQDRCQELAKRIQELEIVFQRNAVERSLNNNKFVAPIQLKRSVGVQVNLRSVNEIKHLDQIEQIMDSESMSSSFSSTSSSDEFDSPCSRKSTKIRSPRQNENIPPGESATLTTNTRKQSHNSNPMTIESPTRKASFTPQELNPQPAVISHPAPLSNSGQCDYNPNGKLPPPTPTLKISKNASGILLSWNMTLSEKHAKVVGYQIFAYQNVSGTKPTSTLLWKKISTVTALPLPMACTLTEFSAGNNYYFAVRAVDSYSRLGQFSLPRSISL